MKDKDKQVEKIAKIANFTAFDYRQGTIQSKTIYTAIAEAIYKYITEDKIVLSREEYKKLKSRADNKCRYDCDLIDMPDFEREKTLIEKTSKETAEKYSKIVDIVCEKHIEYAINKIKHRSAEEFYCSVIKSFAESLKNELAKQFSVEIKEN